MAVGTSDGEYYPSHLEHVLTQMSSVEPSGQNPIDAGRVIRNKSYEQFRDENDLPGAPYQDIRSKTKVAENTDIRTLFPHMPEEERKAWEQSPPRDLQFEYKGKSNILDIPKTLDSKGHEDGLFVDQLHPDLLKLNQDEYDIRYVPNHEIFHIRKKLKPPLVGEADLPENAQPAQYMVGFSSQSDAEKEMKLNTQESDLYTRHLRNLLGSGGVDNEDGTRSSLKADIVGLGDKQYILPTVKDGKFMNIDETVADAKKIGLDKFPSYDTEEEAKARYDQMHSYMEKDTKNYQDAKGAYKSVVDFLTNNLKTPGQEMQNWSGKEMLGYMISTGLGLIGPGQKGSPNLSSRANLPPVDMKLSGKDLGVSNAEPRSFLPANDNPPGVYDRMRNFAEYMKTKPASGREGAPTIGEVLEGFKNADKKTPYDKAVENQQADQLVQSLRRGERPNLTVVENPTQEPQAGYKPSQEQIDAQRNQQREAKVNVGQGKGVLNDNIDLVGAMVAKGMKPSEIAKRFDVTPLAVRNWIKRKGGINSIDDILKQQYQNEDK